MTETNDHHPELTPDERAALSALPREKLPPPDLEERTIAALQSRGLMRRRGEQREIRRRGRRTLVLLAAGVAALLLVFAAGFNVGRGGAAPPLVAATPHFLVLLYEGAAFPTDSVSTTYLVDEYRDWAVELRDGGRLLSAEKLHSSGMLIHGSGDSVSVVAGMPESDEGVVAGYFVIAAAGYEDALAIARRSPHLRHGGRISIRAIDPT